MIVYVVTAQYCDETVVCGVTLNKQIARKIAECEDATEGITPTGWAIDVYDTDDYLPLADGLLPFEVFLSRDRAPEAAATEMSTFKNESVSDGMRKGEPCVVIRVYARDKNHAIQLATDLYHFPSA